MTVGTVGFVERRGRRGEEVEDCASDHERRCVGERSDGAGFPADGE